MVLRQKIDQAAGDFPGLTQCAGTSGKFRNEPCQLLDRLTMAQRRKPACLLPGIEAQTRQSRYHAQRHSIDLVADRREQKLVEIGSQRTERAVQCHRAAAATGPTTSCPEVILVSPDVMSMTRSTANSRDLTWARNLDPDDC